jgi:hypothetical protein
MKARDAVERFPAAAAAVTTAVVAVAAIFGTDLDAADVAPTVGVVLSVLAWLHRRVSPDPKDDRGFRGAEVESTEALLDRKIRLHGGW